jgi:ureidoacrylate peracid hydrolase
MNDQSRSSFPDAFRNVRLDARPEPIEFVPARTAVIVVDLQNGYASKGGYRDLTGRDVGPAGEVVANTLRLLDAARAAGLTVVMLKNGWDAELKTSGGETSPNWHKSNPLKTMRARPELRGKLLTHGTWDYEFVDELKPAPSDIIIEKARYSGFCGTELDNMLRARDIRHLVFVGIATNVCVETTIREAYHREYFCILATDATQHSGPAFVQDATLYNVEQFLGWVSSTDAICQALASARTSVLA